VPVIVDAVRKRFSRRGPWVLDGVTLTLDPGTITVVAAGNGVGKSTLLRIVAGAALPTLGRVLHRPADVGYIPERAPVRIRMTARQYLAHLGRLRGLPPSAVATRIAELSDRLGLAPGPDVQISALSKGNSRKVAAMQALLHPCGLLVVDEPYAGLDAPASAELATLLTEAAEAGAAVLVSAHEHTPGDHVFMLRAGRLHPRGPGDAPIMRITLMPLTGHADVTDLVSFAVTHTTEDGRLTLHTTEADRLLTHALANGWSLLEAGPVEP
jgi:ABC-2 type transport system ATP-binding protein